jgi:ABC-type branched-subunit amino acid transport system substrate-binding protein
MPVRERSLENLLISLRPKRSQTTALAASVVVLALVGVGCGRSGSSTPSGAGTTAPSASATSSAGGVAAGDFGTATKVCRPGSGTGGSGRGIVGKTIHIGTLSDAGAAAAPGLEQEFFDVADAFSKWCNAAGGINGRTIVVDKLDAKLFEGGAQVTQACQTDFMLVGGGNALDAPNVKPRIGCKLGQIPGYTVSPEATAAGFQVSPAASVPHVYPVGVLRLLADAYPATKQGLGVAGSSLSSLIPQGLRAQEGWEALGYKVSTLQPRPALVDNYRPWIEQMKAAGAKADFEIVAQDATPIFTAMNNTGFKPDFALFSSTFYSQKSVQAANSVSYFPSSYVNFYNVPFEMANDFPVVAQAKSIMSASMSKPSYTNFTALGFNSWVLWAQSATACGDNLTQACVLEKAAAHTAWDAGGLFAPVDTNPKTHKPTNCVVIMRLTKTGFVYDKQVTQPNHGIYNCDPRNLVTVKS